MDDYNHLTDPNRRGRITASNVGAILGNSPYRTRADVMRDMVREWHGAESEFHGNPATNWGNANEANAIMAFEIDTGLKTERVKVQTHCDFAACSPDAKLTERNIGVETKCPFSLRKGGPFKSIDEQPHYYDQIQFSLWVTCWDYWYFVQWQPDDVSIGKVFADPHWQSKNLPILRQFYAEYLHEREHNAEEYLVPKRVTVDTPEAHAILREYEELKEARDLADERLKELLGEMVDMAGGKNAEFSGRKLTCTKKAGAVSYAKAIKELCPDADLEKWRGKPSESWSLR